MPDYKNGKIYKLWSLEGDDIYIGSTSQPLYKRLCQHKTTKGCSSKILFEKYNDVKIELLEFFSCDNKDELNKREGEYIRNNICVNKCIAGRTPKEYNEDYKEHIKEHSKEYIENNKEYFKQKNKEYREKNKEHFKQKNKEYREKNKEHVKEKKKEWYENNKEQKCKKIICECGKETTINHKSRHELSKFHQEAISKNHQNDAYACPLEIASPPSFNV